MATVADGDGHRVELDLAALPHADGSETWDLFMEAAAAGAPGSAPSATTCRTRPP